MKSTDNLKYMSATSFNSMNRANVYWQPNRYCNYECSYCWPSAHTKVKDFVDKDLAFKTIDRAVELFKAKGVLTINWGWSGGEATFHPNFLDFQKRILTHHCDSMIMSFNITTNLSHNLPWWKKFVDVIRPYKLKVVICSLHQEYVNTPAKVDKFIEKLDFLKANDIQVLVNQVMDPDIFDDQLKVLEQFYEKNYFVSPKINSTIHKNYLQWTGKTIYTEDQLKIMNKSQDERKTSWPLITVKDKNDNIVDYSSFEQIKNEGLWDLRDWICSVGYLSIAIEGNIVKRGVGGCHQQYLGKLDEDWQLYDEPKLCGVDGMCTCVADLKLPKWNPKHASESEWKRT
jgi:sulfatase maturation enzyme AslB (radical SAM superfamily)